MMNQSLISAQENLECAICFMYLRDPVLTICGHRFCEKCLSKWLTDHDNRCPIDYNQLGADDIFPEIIRKERSWVSRSFALMSVALHLYQSWISKIITRYVNLERTNSKTAKLASVLIKASDAISQHQYPWSYRRISKEAS
jgi:hypothetical protein